MKKMVSLLVVGAMVLGGSALVRAESQTPPAGKSMAAIEQAKSKKIEEIEQKIKLLQDDKTCVTAAKSKEELKKCRATAKAATSKMTEEKKAKRAEAKAKKEEMKAMKGK